jgi:dihydrodipicolinate reductase
MKYKEIEYEVKILQEAKYGKKGELTIAYIDLEDGSQLIGVGEHSKTESYSQDRGKIVAIGRLQKKITKRMKAEKKAAEMKAKKEAENKKSP